MQVLWDCRQMVAGRQVGYYLLAEEVEARKRYGVKIEAEDGELSEVRDVTLSQCEGLTLVALLAHHAVTPVALRDIVDDWLLR